jgi:hypothetical protein
MEFYENLRRAGEKDGRPLVLRQQQGWLLFPPNRFECIPTDR